MSNVSAAAEINLKQIFCYHKFMRWINFLCRYSLQIARLPLGDVSDKSEPGTDSKDDGGFGKGWQLQENALLCFSEKFRKQFLTTQFKIQADNELKNVKSVSKYQADSTQARINGRTRKPSLIIKTTLISFLFVSFSP